MKFPKGVLLVSHDLSYAFTKTTESMGTACERLGIKTVVRDCCDARLSCLVLDNMDDTEPMAMAEKFFKERWDQLIEDFEIDCVVSLDFGWQIVPDYLLDHPKIKKIYSIWFDDPWSWCRARTNAIYPYRKRSFLLTGSHPKVLHAAYGDAFSRELKLMGFLNQLPSKLAAPKEFLSMNYPCEVVNKLAFIGNPGYRGEPHPEAIRRMHEGAEIQELREMSRDDILMSIKNNRWIWAEREPNIKHLLAYATQIKIECPHLSALEIIEICGEKYPAAFQALNESGNILDAAWLVKLVLRYDRPAIVYRLYKKGLLDVISNPEEWKPYGIESSISVFADEMPKYYMKYLAHINAANATRDATANEKLFEIAGCGRVSINLDSLDVRACYDENEVIFVKAFSEAEEAARDLISNPDRAFSMGKRARIRTAKDHTWDQRLSQLFEKF